ncbi:MAG TPA: hypothetical protein VLF87_01225 [Patescibacteria group bacterium]|nr:hypothetical protein [Patescibacteria group bacterium]
MPRVVINPAWAEALDPKDIFEYNQFSAESLAQDIDLPRLGGLTVELVTSRIATPELLTDARAVKHIIDLSFGEPAVETHTGLLLAASMELLGPDDLLTRQLKLRSKGDDGHGPIEPWFLARWGVTLIELSPGEVTD